jgi:hypothetical protein
MGIPRKNQFSISKIQPVLLKISSSLGLIPHNVHDPDNIDYYLYFQGDGVMDIPAWRRSD